jgi:hypothetical protein
MTRKSVGFLAGGALVLPVLVLLGEYPEEYEDGRFKTAESTWFSGLEGAKPGGLMRANPRPGTPSCMQGVARRIEFQDRAKVSKPAFGHASRWSAMTMCC